MYYSERTYFVYKHTSPSGKVYIGISSSTPEKRWRNGRGYVGNDYFYKAIKKYGWDNFSHEILSCDLSFKDATSLEIELISKYNSNLRDFGYNLTSGGECTQYTQETIDKMCKISKEIGSRPSVRESRSQTMREKWKSRSFIEKRNSTLSKNRLSKETIEKLGEGLDNKCAEDKNLVDSVNPNYDKTRINSGKRVWFDGKTFRSVSECSRYLNIARRTLSQYLSGERTISQDYKDKGLKYAGERCEYIESENTKNRQVYCDGITFSSCAEADRHYGLYKDTIRDWLTGRVKLGAPKEFQEKGLRFVNEKRYVIVHKK